MPAWKQLKHVDQSKRGRCKASQLQKSTGQRVINDNYCIAQLACVEVVRQDCVNVAGKKQTLDNIPVNYYCFNSYSFCRRVTTTERHKSRHCSTSGNKICEKCYLCRSLEFLFKKCHKCFNCCYRSTCRHHILGKMACPGGQSQCLNSPQGRLHCPLPDLVKSVKVTHHHKWVCKSPQEPLPDGGIACTYAKEELGHNSKKSLGFYNRLFLVPKPNNGEDLTVRTSLQAGEWVTSKDFKDTYFHIPIQNQCRKYMRFHIQEQCYQFKALPFSLSTAPMEFTVAAKEAKLIQKGIKIHHYPDDWLFIARFY